MVGFEMSDHRLDFHPLLERPFEPAVFTVAMRLFAPFGDRQLLNAPAPLTVALLFIGLIKSAIGGNQLRALAGIRPHAIEHRANGLGISDILLILAVREDQTVVIHCHTDQAAELNGLVGFALFDDGHLVLVQTVKTLFRLLPL